MIAGTPETFAVLTEKVSGWRSEDKISGILHICINGVAYPRKPRPTDVERDIRRLFDESVSAFACPKISRKLFGRKGRKLFNRLREMRFPQYYSTDSEAKEDRRYDAVFIGPATAGYHVFVLSDGQNVRLLIKGENNEYDPMDVYRIVRFNESKKERRIQWVEFESALIGSEETKKAGYVQFAGQKYGEKSYLLTIPASELEKGEYGIFFTSIITATAIPVGTFRVK